MNQILSTGNNDKQKKSRNSDIIDMRKIIIIFSIIIVVFALVIISAKIYGIIKEKAENSDTPVVVLNKPSIKIEKVDNVCKIEIIYDEGLQKVTYWWNDDDTIIEKNLNGSKTPFITQISIPEGDQNTLTVKATGIDGSSNEMKQEFMVEKPIEDENKPKISWYHYEGTTKMDIIARSDIGIANLSYQWEGEEAVTVNSTEEEQEELKITIEAKRGTNKLYLTATDTNGNTQTKEGSIIGVLAPDIKVILENNKILKINITHDSGFKKIVININGQELVYDENNPEYKRETTNLNTSLEVPPGTLTVKIKVYTLEEEDKEYPYEASTQIPG